MVAAFTQRCRIAYFSMEIALRPEIHSYAGGLGILAGDTVRSCADLELPVVFVTLISRNGYLRQVIDADGRQGEPHHGGGRGRHPDAARYGGLAIREDRRRVYGAIAFRCPRHPQRDRGRTIGGGRRSIVDALRRSAITDAENITVSATGGTVTIGGIVRTWQERELALGTAWSTPGVQCVEDLIVIRP